MARGCRPVAGPTNTGVGMHNQRIFILVACLLVAAMDAAFQKADAQSASSVPDLSGLWGRPFVGFELPLSGPGPVRNTSRLPSGASNIGRLTGDYTNPILKPEAAEIIKKRAEISLSGVPFPDPGNQCFPQGVPYIFWNFQIQMLQQPHQITILYDEDHEVRHVRMNERHPAQVTPSWYGDSVGHFGTPHTEALHVIERYRLIDYEAAKEAQDRAEKEWTRIPPYDADPDYKGKGLQLEFTVEDEGVFTMPWTAIITYRRPLAAWEEYACTENIHEYYAGRDTAVPRADKPDF
jgi:hypothetical protein